MAKRELTEEARANARKDFNRIIKERLDSRIERGETYTSTRDLYKGYETLHSDGFSEDQFIAASVAQILNKKEYKNKLFYARDVNTHRAERVYPGKSAPYKIYLRPDATPPINHVLVPFDAKKDEIAEYIAMTKGASDSTIRTTETAKKKDVSEIITVDKETVTVEPVSYKSLVFVLSRLASRQGEMIYELVSEIMPVIESITEKTEDNDLEMTA